jgi:hypothetical protein
LGLHRSLAVSQILHARTGFPSASILATSMGDIRTLFPDDNDSSKARNRTVSFRLVPKNAVSGEEVTETYESSR